MEGSAGGEPGGAGAGGDEAMADHHPAPGAADSLPAGEAMDMSQGAGPNAPGGAAFGAPGHEPEHLGPEAVQVVANLEGGLTLLIHGNPVGHLDLTGLQAGAGGLQDVADWDSSGEDGDFLSDEEEESESESESPTSSSEEDAADPSYEPGAGGRAGRAAAAGTAAAATEEPIRYSAVEAWQEVTSKDVEDASIKTSSSHFQTADSLLCQQVAPDGPEELLVARDGKLQLFRVLEDGEAELMAKSPPLGFGPYTLARSPDGTVLAAGGGNGLLSVYWLDLGEAEVDQRMKLMVSLEVGGHPGESVHEDDSDDDGPQVTGSGMVNSLRFGTVAGRLRLLIASQDRFVYVMNVPTAFTTALPDLLCDDLHDERRAEYPQVPRASRRVEVGEIFPTADAEGMLIPNTAYPRASRRTDVIGNFRWPVNCAVPSPDGQHIAVVGDGMEVWVCHRDSGCYQARPTRLFFPQPPGRNVTSSLPGCQYAAWNRASSYLAASSDSDKGVCVWDMRTGDLIATFFDMHRRPCLALQFVPWDDRTLVWCEEKKYVHMADVELPDPRLSHQKFTTDLPQAGAPTGLAETAAPPTASNTVSVPFSGGTLHFTGGATAPLFLRPRITGLAVTAKGSMYISVEERAVLKRDLLSRWTVGRHRRFPRKFRGAVQALVMGASAAPAGEESPDAPACRLSSLPEAIFHGIIGRAAMPLAEWAPRDAASGPRSGRARATPPRR